MVNSATKGSSSEKRRRADVPESGRPPRPDSEPVQAASLAVFQRVEVREPPAYSGKSSNDGEAGRGRSATFRGEWPVRTRLAELEKAGGPECSRSYFLR